MKYDKAATFFERLAKWTGQKKTPPPGAGTTQLRGNSGGETPVLPIILSAYYDSPTTDRRNDRLPNDDGARRCRARRPPNAFHAGGGFGGCDGSAARQHDGSESEHDEHRLLHYDLTSVQWQMICEAAT